MISTHTFPHSQKNSGEDARRPSAFYPRARKPVDWLFLGAKIHSYSDALDFIVKKFFGSNFSSFSCGGLKKSVSARILVRNLFSPHFHRTPSVLYINMHINLA